MFSLCFHPIRMVDGSCVLSHNDIIIDTISLSNASESSVSEVNDQVKEFESMAYVCGQCGIIGGEVDINSMIMCDGGCRRPFHIHCSGMSKIPYTYKCYDCLNNLVLCSICNIRGVYSDENFVECVHPNCELSFHKSCVMQNQHFAIDTQFDKGMIICRRHICSNPECKNRLVPLSPPPESTLCCFNGCLKCFHLECRPENFMEILPDGSVGFCPDHGFQPEFFVDRELASIKKNGEATLVSTAIDENLSFVGVAAWRPTFIDALEHEDENLYSMITEGRNAAKTELESSSNDMKDANIQSQSRANQVNYIKATSNVWLCPKNLYKGIDDAGLSCKCEGVCDRKTCFNARTFIECSSANCSITKSKPSGNCGNRSIQVFSKKLNSSLSSVQKEATAAFEVFSCSSDGKGKGLRARRQISKGELIVEYIGEVLSSEQWRARAVALENLDCDRYALALSSRLVLDASRRGGEGRYMNHSCNPNCRAERWEVVGAPRVGLFASQDLEVGTELTFDYQFDSRNSTVGFECLCGAENCRRRIGGGGDMENRRREETPGERALAFLVGESNVDVKKDLAALNILKRLLDDVRTLSYAEKGDTLLTVIANGVRNLNQRFRGLSEVARWIDSRVLDRRLIAKIEMDGETPESYLSSPHHFSGLMRNALSILCIVDEQSDEFIHHRSRVLLRRNLLLGRRGRANVLRRLVAHLECINVPAVALRNAVELWATRGERCCECSQVDIPGRSSSDNRLACGSCGQVMHSPTCSVFRKARWLPNGHLEVDINGSIRGSMPGCVDVCSKCVAYARRGKQRGEFWKNFMNVAKERWGDVYLKLVQVAEDKLNNESKRKVNTHNGMGAYRPNGTQILRNELVGLIRLDFKVGWRSAQKKVFKPIKKIEWNPNFFDQTEKRLFNHYHSDSLTHTEL